MSRNTFDGKASLNSTPENKRAKLMRSENHKNCL